MMNGLLFHYLENEIQMIRRNFFIARLFMLSTILSSTTAWGAAQEDTAGPVILRSVQELRNYAQTLLTLVHEGTLDARVLNIKARKLVHLELPLNTPLSPLDYESC